MHNYRYVLRASFNLLGAILFILRIYLDETQLRIDKLTCFQSNKAELLSPKIEIFSIHLLLSSNLTSC